MAERRVDFTGKRVAIIGTGSSAVQSIPLIAEEADELVVYQRTAAIRLTAFNRPLTNSEIDTMKGNYDQYRQEQGSARPVSSIPSGNWSGSWMCRRKNAKGVLKKLGMKAC